MPYLQRTPRRYGQIMTDPNPTPESEVPPTADAPARRPLGPMNPRKPYRRPWTLGRAAMRCALISVAIILGLFLLSVIPIFMFVVWWAAVIVPFAAIVAGVGVVLGVISIVTSIRKREPISEAVIAIIIGLAVIVFVLNTFGTFGILTE